MVLKRKKKSSARDLTVLHHLGGRDRMPVPAEAKVQVDSR